MTRVYEITTQAELTVLRELWADLLAQTAGADFFRTLDWLDVYWRHYGADQRLRVLVVSEDNRPIGILPLVVRKDRTRLGKYRVLTYPLSYWGSFYGPVGPEPRRVLEAGLQYAMRQPRDFDLIDLRWITMANDREDWVAESFAEAGMMATRRSMGEIAIVDMQSGWDAYWASRSGNWRSNCRRNEKRLARKGDIEYVRYRPRGAAHGEGDPRWDLYDECEQIARRSWQGSSANGTTITHPDVRPFFRAVHEAAAWAGGVDVNLLRVDGQPAAFIYGYHYRGYVSSVRMGFNPDFVNHGVGTVLAYRTIRNSFERGDQVYDFLPGSHEAKRPWQTSAEACYRYEYLPFRPGRVELLRVGRWLGDLVEQFRTPSGTT